MAFGACENVQFVYEERLPQLPKLTLVVPILNEIENLAGLRSVVELIRKGLDSQGHTLEVILNDNFSDDGSSGVLSNWALEEPGVIHIRFETRLTFQQSIMRGFRVATGDCLVLYQGDLQDPWEQVLEFFSLWLQGAKVVVGVATNVHSGWQATVGRKIFYWLLRIGASSDMQVGFQDFYLLDRGVYSEIGENPNHFQFIRGTIASDYKIDDVVNYRRLPRVTGKSKFPFDERYELALDGLLIHSKGFTRRLSLFGLILSIFSILGVVGALLVGILGLNAQAPGWLSIASTLAFMVGLISFVSALQLEYLRRILVLEFYRAVR
jgi:glycosyltransferase involved in cell wall biosynthesis